MEQCSRHHEKFAGHAEIQFLHHRQIVQILLSNQRNGNIVDVDLVLLDEVQEEIEGAFEVLDLDLVGQFRLVHQVLHTPLDKVSILYQVMVGTGQHQNYIWWGRGNSFGSNDIEQQSDRHQNEHNCQCLRRGGSLSSTGRRASDPSGPESKAVGERKPPVQGRHAL